MKRIRKIFIWGGLSVVGFLSLLLLTGSVLYRHFPGEWAGKILAHRLQQESGWKFEIGTIAPFPLSHFSIGPISITSPDGRKAVALKQLSVEYEIDPLFEKQLVIRSVVLDSPEIIVWKEGEAWNLQLLSEKFIPPQKNSPPSPLADFPWDRTPVDRLWPAIETHLETKNIRLPVVRIDHLEVRALQVTAEPGAGLSFTLPPTNVIAKLAIAPQKEFRGEWRVDPSAESKHGTVSGRLAFDLHKGWIRTTDAHLDIPGFVHAEGSLSLERFGVELIMAKGRLDLAGGKVKPPLDRFVHVPSDVFPEGLPEIRATAALSVEKLRHLKIQSAEFSSSTLGISSALAGSVNFVTSLPSFYEEWKKSSSPLGVFRKNVTADLSGSMNIELQRVKHLLPGLEMKGVWKSSLRLQKPDLNRVNLSVDAEAKKLSVKTATADVEELYLHVPLSKTLYLGAVPANARFRSGGSPWAKSLLADLRPISSFNHTIRAKRIAAAGYTLEDVDMDAGFDDVNLIVDRFTANLLGGTIWARMTIVPEPGAVRLSTAMEAVDINVAKLSGPARTKKAKISADLRMDLLANVSETPTPDRILDELEAQFHLTKIGDDTLTQLIAFLDPKGENPSMVQARGLLQDQRVAEALRNPEAQASISHGILDADLKLPGVKFVDLSIPIRGLSVKKLLTFESFKKTVEDLAPMISQARYLQVVGVDDHGAPIFPSLRPTLRN